MKPKLDVIPIVFSSDDNYAPFCGIAISSLLKNLHSDRQIHIYIIDGGISSENKHKIDRLQNDFDNVEISFILPGSCLKKYQKISGARSESYFFRFLIPDLLREYEKAIYLDCDVLILSDISKLFDIDISDYVAGVVKDDLVYKRYLKESQNYSYYNGIGMSLEDMENYFNSGVMLMNVRRFRDGKVFEKLKYFYNNYENIFFKDQDALNWALRKNVVFLDSLWNVTQNNFEQISRLAANKERPFIIHYTPIRPWEFPSYKYYERRDILKKYLQFKNKDLKDHKKILKNFKSLWIEYSKYSAWPNLYGKYKSIYDNERGFISSRFYKNSVLIDKINLGLSFLPNSRLREAFVNTLSYVKRTFFEIKDWRGFFPAAGKRRWFKVVLNSFLFFVPIISVRIMLKKLIQLIFLLVGCFFYKIYLAVKMIIKSSRVSFLNLAPDEVIVSMTSIESRLKFTYWALLSLVNQSQKPRCIILWLGDNISEEKIPKKINDLKKYGVKIKFTKDIGPHTKLIPSLKDYPDHILVTADDDVMYSKHWLKFLLEENRKHPDVICAHRVRKIEIHHNSWTLYKDWKVVSDACEKSFAYFLTGVGGVLYPPQSLDIDVFKEEIFSKICPKNDDIWFYAMAVKNGVRIKRIDKAITNLIYVDPLQEFGLKNITLLEYNVNNGGNDRQFREVINFYDLGPKILNF